MINFLQKYIDEVKAAFKEWHEINDEWLIYKTIALFSSLNKEDQLKALEWIEKRNRKLEEKKQRKLRK